MQKAEGKKASLVCFALKEEALPFQKISADRPEVSILITGIGRKNAERSLREFLATRSPARVLTCGFAGGLDPALESAAVVFETDEPALRERLGRAGAKPAKFCCADRIATTIAEKAELRQSTGADAVEMESGAIQRICHERGIPCAIVRVISDTAQEDLPLDFNELLTPEREMDYSRLARALLKAPGKIGALLKLQKQTKAAAEALARVLSQLFSQ